MQTIANENVMGEYVQWGEKIVLQSRVKTFLFPSCPTGNKNLESLQIFLFSETGSPDGKFAFLLRTPGTVHM